MHGSDTLLSLAQDRSRPARIALFRTMGDLLLGPAAELSDRERAEAAGILERLLTQVEADVRAALSAELAARADIPHSLVKALASDEIKVARPILLKSPLLDDADLIEIVRLRSREHRIAVATRPDIAEIVSDALIETGEELVVEALIRNTESHLSRRAIEYLVGESQRVDRFREPLVRRQDLPKDLAQRMYAWVAESLRAEIADRFAVDPIALNEAIAATVVADQPNALDLATKLARSARAQGLLNERYVLQNLRAGHMTVASAGIAELAGIAPDLARRCLLDPTGEGVAMCSRAAGIGRAGAAILLALTAKANDRPAAGRLGNAELVALYDRVSVPQAQAALRFWARHPDLLAAGARA